VLGAVGLLAACASSASDLGGGGGAGGGGDDGGAPNVVPGGDGGGGSDGGAGCPSGQSLCGGSCIDTTGDDRNCGGCGHACTGAQHCAGGSCQDSKIQHVVLIVEENHTFDSYFGHYCQAPAYTDPTCTSGPSCCEAAPDTEPGSTHAKPYVLNDDPNNPASNFGSGTSSFDRDHMQACELQEIDDANMDGHGKMDRFVTGATGSDTCDGYGPSCSNAINFAVADQATLGAYWSLADGNALADRYFQPIAGGSSSNDMYLAAAHFQFKDNDAATTTAGGSCSASPCASATSTSYTGRTTIADLLVKAGKTFAVYADGYGDAKSAAPGCPGPSSDCRYAPLVGSSCLTSPHPIACGACTYDPTDIPFNYYAQDGDQYMKDYSQLAADLNAGTLPSFAYVKAEGWHNEHPNVSTIADGIAFVTSTIGMIQSSPLADSTLILLTWDEGGGFFDHVSPPAPWPTAVDQDDAGGAVPYGTRVPLLAIGPFARKGTVSHVVMEHSSVVKFLEYNFVGGVGQLGARDAKVNDLGSLLDPAATGIVIPEQ